MHDFLTAHGEDIIIVYIFHVKKSKPCKSADDVLSMLSKVLTGYIIMATCI